MLLCNRIESLNCSIMHGVVSSEAENTDMRSLKDCSCVETVILTSV